MMEFGSDNEAPIRDEILQALHEANQGRLPSYGEDSLTRKLTDRFTDVFETDACVQPVITGTAANGIALSCLVPGYGATICHQHAHINLHECGAPEFFTGGKIITVGGADGKIDAAGLECLLQHHTRGRYHTNVASALSLTQATEYGVVYTLEELSELSTVAHTHGLKVHMDGARFANAMAFLGCTPAEATWKAGIDILSFGSSKNGTLNAEAIVVFDPDSAVDLQRRLKRAGHLASKLRYVSAQLLAYLEDERWINWAAQANQLARTLGESLASNPDIDVKYPIQANMIIMQMPEPMVEYLHSSGVVFYPWHEMPGHYRLVLSNLNATSDVDGLIRLLADWKPSRQAT